MNANVYQHFRNEEHPFIDNVHDWIEQVENQYAPYLTDFLDPRQAYIVEILVRQSSDLKFAFYGGYNQAERRRALIFPDYYQPTPEDFQMELIAIKYPEKFVTLSHGKILGTLLHTGVKREFFGDIMTDGSNWQFFMAQEIGHFVRMQVDKIGSVSIRLEEKQLLEIITPKDEWSEEKTTVSSLRLDAIIASVYQISRQRAKQLIESGKVKVNWTQASRPDFLLGLLDIVSVRGYGRIQIQELEGTTKKEKIKLVLGVLRK
ncbi:MAG: RNA-binding protein [Enterococcus sp.]